MNKQENKNEGLLSGMTNQFEEIAGANILGLKRSIKFNKQIVDSIIDNKEVEKLSFRKSGISGEPTSFYNLVNEACGNGKQDFEQCRSEFLMRLLLKSYVLRDVDRKEKNYVLQVSGSNDTTVFILLKNIQKSLSNYISQTRRVFLEREKNATVKLIYEKKEELAIENYQQLLEDKATIETRITESDDKVKESGRVIVNLENVSAQAVAQLDETKKTLEQAGDFSQIQKDKKRKKLKEKIERLTNDIQALEVVNSDLDKGDHDIISRLKEDLQKTKQEFGKLGEFTRFNIRSQKFMEQKDTKFDYKKFDYDVIVKQLESVKGKIEILKKEKAKYIERKLEIQQKYDRIAPTIKLLTALEKKLIELSLKINTVSDNLEFDTVPRFASKSKKIGKLLGSAYIIIISFIFLVMGVILRYLFDKKIYSYDQLSELVGDGKVIGKSPKFSDS